MITNSSTVWVFDLDDTLFQERDYQTSGYEHIALIVKKLYGVDVTDTINHAIGSKADVLQRICEKLKLPNQVKESLLWLYRLHHPSVNLSNDIEATLNIIKQSALSTAIITDGRSVSQRLKANSLGLDSFELLISEEWEETKPGKKRFEYIEKKFPNAKRYIYVGDNVLKDFVTPNILGWLTLGILDSGLNIHSQNAKDLDDIYHPNQWLSCFSDLTDYIC